MTQLIHDPHWLDAKTFIKTHLTLGERIVAPVGLKAELPNTYSYDFTFSHNVNYFQWVLIHKGMNTRLNWNFLQQVLAKFKPVFANEVFVILTSRTEIRPADFNPEHLQALIDKVDPASQAITRSQSGMGGLLSRLIAKVKPRLNYPDREEFSNQINGVFGRLDRLEKNLRVIQEDVKAQQSVTVRYGDRITGKMSLSELQSVSRAACQTAYLGEGIVLCRILKNYLLYGDAKDIGILPHLCLNGYWEPWISLAFLRVLQPGWNCIDVGANHGYYSVLMAGAVGESGRVVALEPNPKLARLVSRTIEVNGFRDWTSVAAKAVSNRLGETIRLMVPTGQTGHATMMRDATATDEVFEAETVTIDQLTQGWEQVNFIKIDAEGAEQVIWEGMQETIRRNPDIIVVLEFGSARYAKAREFLQEIIAEGFKLRYVGYDAEIHEITIDQCLNDRVDSYWDLFLSRR
ncbi:MAG TPA: FkbM family methyltransferase [Trichocoleus sp.]|jgi:FkbM family methyltransferase